MNLKRLSVVILTLTILSCTSYVVTPLPLPSEPPERPSEASLECLDDDTYKVIVRAYKRIKTLEGIIESTHK